MAHHPQDALPLYEAAVLERIIRAGMARVWENVLDWEHLPHLHAGSFAACELLRADGSGWEVLLRSQGQAAHSRIRLLADRAAGHYTVTTLEGAGTGNEVRTALTALAPDRTAIRVSFHVPAGEPDRLKSIGAGYRKLYERLWDEDETMMVARTEYLERERGAANAGPVTPVNLGREGDVRARLPFVAMFGSHAFRLIEIDGEIIAHGAHCPHWGGPLADAPVADGRIACPWHGYEFVARSGKCVGGRTRDLAPPPRVAIEDGAVFLQ